MKKIAMALVFVLFAISISASANAETHRRFRRQSLWHLAVLPAYYLIGVGLHEGSHAVAVGVIPQTEITDFRPYPHFMRFSDGSRRFVNGSIHYQWERCNPPSDGQLALIFLSPYFIDIAIFTATDLMLSLGAISPRSPLGGVMYMIGMVGTGIDFFYNLLGSLNGNDFTNAAGMLGIHPAVFTAIGATLSAVALWRVIRVGYDVFTEPVDGPREPQQRCRRRTCRRRVVVAPFMGDGGCGLAIGGAM